MAANRSFTDYVSSRFYNEFYSAIEKYIEENPDNLDLDLKNVKQIGGISLSEVEVKFVSVRDLPELKIEFDVIVEAEIGVDEGDYHYDDYDLFNKWFLLRCYGDLECSLDDFAIREICLYSQKNKNPQPLSDSLVPYIKREQLDAVAHDFLQRHYPEVLKKPMPLEPEILAEKMGLEVILRDITEDLSVFGQIFFHDSEAEFYDPDEEECISTSVRARTIFVDPKAYFLRNLGAVNNTIVHECVHWDKHRKAFELERLYNSSATKIKCQVAGGIKNSNKEATDWMEWQANALAPRIQMPLAMFKTKAFEFIKEYRQQSGTTEIIDVMEPVIDALATFFCVSRIAAKIRMIDAGYEEAIGTFTYLDGRYIKPHGFRKGSLKRNQTFSIGAVDAAIQSMTNPELSALVKDGSYQYVDAHFVLNHPKYLEQDLFGNTRLTDYARTHMDECCIVFDLSIESNVRERYHSECFLNRDETSNISFNIRYGGGYEHSTQENKVKLLANELAENARMYSELPTSYTSSLKMVKKWRGVTFKELEERTMLSERTIRRIVNGEEQGSSYDVQVKHYTSYIEGNAEWELAGIFADDGISGTNTKKREEFNRMIEACMDGNIDMIITKSISRFARNTLDCLKYIRQLKDKDIAVFFEKENINTMDSKGEIMLTIMASLAQQESQSLSQNVKLGIQYRYQQGEVQVNHNRFLGYTKDENKRLVIDPVGAEVVKRIYREYLEGASLLQIARGLEAEGILTAAKKKKWRPETIKKILQNEKYIGDALLQKTYTVDFLSKKRVVNNGIVPQYYVENSHEPIIPREIFMQVQEELVRRANLYTGKSGKKRVYSSKYALSSIVYCSECGEIYRRVHWNNRGCRSIVWRCVSRLEEKGSDCPSPTINEEVLKAAVVKAMNEVLSEKDTFLAVLKENIATVLNDDSDQATKDIDEKLADLQKELLRLANSKADYEEVADEIYRLRELKQSTLVENAESEGKRERIIEMAEFLDEQPEELEEYDEQLVRRLIEKVTVFEEKFTVEFKSDVGIDVEV